MLLVKTMLMENHYSLFLKFKYEPQGLDWVTKLIDL